MQEARKVERRSWWQRPSLHAEEEEQQDRRVTWLELFYDLVFVAVIAQLSHNLAEHISWSGVAGYALLFLPVWWVWIAGTFINERFETHGLESRVFTFLQMLPVAAMAVFAHDALGETGAGFALAYAAARSIHVFLWARAAYYVPVARPWLKWYVVGFTISIFVFILSAFVNPPLRYWLWILGLAIDLLTPVLTLEHQRLLPRFSTSRLPERLGLFVIIVLGESVVGTIQGVSASHHVTWTVGLVAVMGMALAFGLWSVYFDFVARRPAKPLWWTLGWTYLHLPLVMGLAAVGAGILNLVGNTDAVDAAKVLISAAVGLALIVIGLLEMTLRRDETEPTHPLLSPFMKIFVGILAIALGMVSGSFSVIGLLLILSALLLTQIIYGAYVWFTQEIPISDTID